MTNTTPTQIIIGVDEAGRGPLAGPVVAAAVALPVNFKNPAIQDSKKLSPQRRAALYDEIIASALDYKIIAVGPRRIEQINIRQATYQAMSLAVTNMTGDIILIDGNMTISAQLPQKTVIGGDRIHVQISAASILAKVYRDRLMLKLEEQYPGYGFAKHAGYGTEFHRSAIAKLGPSPAHRKTFAGVKEFVRKSPSTIEYTSSNRESPTSRATW